MTESADIISLSNSRGSVPFIIWFCTQAKGPAVGFHSAPDKSDIPDIQDNLKCIKRGIMLISLSKLPKHNSEYHLFDDCEMKYRLIYYLHNTSY